MTFATAIQTYDGAHASHNNGDGCCAVDWANTRLWMAGTVSAVTYLSRYGIVSGAEQADVTASSIISGITIPGVGCDTDGYVYGSGPNGLNNGSITRIDGTTLGFKSNSGYTAVGFGAHSICALKVGGSQYVLDNDVGSDVIGVLNGTYLSVGGKYIANFGWLGNARCHVCMGNEGTGRGYLLSSPGGSSDTQVSHLQRIDLAHASASTLASYAPTDFDAGWTEAYARGMCLDQTDGNMIASVSGVGNTHYNYLVKISAITGAIIWKRLLTTTGAEAIGGEQMNRARIRNQRLAIVQSTPANTITVINTADGSVVGTPQTTGLAGLTIWGQQSFDDTSGVIVGMFDYSIVTGSPAPLNGSTTGFRGWAALYVTQAQATPGIPSGPATSRRRAWTYTLDGHVFYVLDMGQEGTWQYDKATQEWSNYYTKDYVQWNVCNGSMWGNRIVGGDLNTSDVYEVAASNVQDNGGVDIPHCVTGALVTRSRDSMSCNDLLLSASLGTLGNAAGSAMDLQYSDDDGNTWIDADPIAMVEGDFSTELRWRSLGSFSAPGRIFKLSDVGGPVTIKGCDAFIPNFDSEAAPGE